MHIQIGRDLERQPRFLQAEQESDTAETSCQGAQDTDGPNRRPCKMLTWQTKQIKYDQWASRFSTWLAVC